MLVQHPQLYGEHWTPLLAAVVGGHVRVARQLLADLAAGGGPAAARQLLCSCNKNGQSALHVAAQLGNVAMLQSLLDAGAGGQTLNPKLGQMGGGQGGVEARRVSLRGSLEVAVGCDCGYWK